MSMVDDTHFFIDVDSSRTFGFTGETEVRCVDVVSNGEAFATMVLLSGGEHGRIEAPLIGLTNWDSNYQIKGVPYDVPGVAYRAGLKG